ncbi:hypothetical protein FD723_17455 [Nostoc sp. C052]|uniref:hypothetical protein n=1 Tax=Nostoc sp. C052 TaxID=2576902 RepID=UPI0015C3526A|nr:hypothetical protein [Nostoc sp. C052]QLE42028.1 hypothetical protein FD723_17455 [Nostoc sp. C052]
MKDSHDRITNQTATELFALAAQLQGQKSHDYAPSELVQAATEAGISPDNLQEALQLMRIKQTRRRNLRLILSSGVAGVAIACAGVWAYFTLNQQSAMRGQILPGAIANLESPVVPNAPATDGYAVTYTGIVQQYLLNPEGRVDGLLLKNGLQVKFPPHVGEQLVIMIQGNDKVQVQGFGSRNSYGQVIEATQLTINGQNVALTPPVVSIAPLLPKKP